MILITAPTGQIGRRLVNTRLDGDEPLRLIVRDPAKLPEPVRRRAEVIEGSHGDPDVVGKALVVTEAIFWLYPSDPRAADARAHMLDFHRPVCEAIVRHGVPHVVSVAALGRV